MESLVIITTGVMLCLQRPSRLQGILAAGIPVSQWICTCRHPARAWAAAAKMHSNVATNRKKKKVWPNLEGCFPLKVLCKEKWLVRIY